MSTPTGPSLEGLRERVLERSLGLRPAGRATPEPEPISAVEAVRRTSESLAELLDGLDDAQWRRPVLRGLDVQGLIGHLIGVEQHVEQAVAGDESVARADHVASTQASALAQRDLTPSATREAWVSGVARAIAALAARDGQDLVALYGTRLPIAGVCIARAFELWTHENDIRQALGLPASTPDAATLTLMTRLATDLLPRAAAAHDLAPDVALRLVLTGPGGGTWQLTLGDVDSPEPARVGIVADAVAFCRLVANRVTPGDLDAHITGDPGLAEVVLQAATTLALD